MRAISFVRIAEKRFNDFYGLSGIFELASISAYRGSPNKDFRLDKKEKSSGGAITTLERSKTQTVTETRSTVIAVTGLSKTFGTLYALRNLSFSLNKGEFLTIFGPNGAGKTTLIRILSTITKATSGEIQIGEFSFENDSEEIRRQIGVIAHQTFLYENLTAEENLRFYGKLYDVENLSQKIETIISEVGLGLRKKDFVRTFSRGMQQRLAIARAMLHEPAILLLDEPYTGLDQHASEMLTNWLKRLRSAEQTILLVTHDLEQGMELADRVAVLVNGQLVLNQPQQEIDSKKFRQTYYDLVEKSRQ